MSLEATEVPHSASLVALPIVFMLHPCLSDLDSQKQKTRVEVSQLTSQPQCLTDSVWAGFFASKSPEGKRSNGHNDDEWSSETVTGRSRFVEALSPIFCIIKNPLQFTPRMHSFQESASPRQCRHSGGLCACMCFLTLTPLRTGTSLKTSIQTCFGITGEDIFHLSASLLKCHYPRNSCWKVLSHLIIVNNIILLLNGLGKEKTNGVAVIGCSCSLTCSSSKWEGENSN